MKFLYGVAALVGLLVIAAFVAPFVINWDWLKPTIASQAEESLGRELGIDGSVEVRLLPTPRISVSDARLANLAGGSAADMARAKRLDLELALGPLIGGRIEVTSVVLVDPVIELERLANGEANWHFVAKPKAASAGEQPQATSETEGDDAVLGTAGLQTLELVNGALTFRDSGSGRVEHMHGVEASVVAREAGGPYQARGRLKLREQPLEFDGSLGRSAGDGTTPLSFVLRLEEGSAAASFSGSLDRAASRLAGGLEIKGENLAGMLDRFGLALPIERGASDEPFALTGSLSGSTDRLDLKDVDLKFGDTAANGALSYVDGEPAQLDVLLTLNKLDLDRFAAASPEAGDAAALDGDVAASADATPPAPSVIIAAAERKNAESGFAIPAELKASINLTIEAVSYRDTVIRAVQSILSLEQGAITIQQASAELPGGGDASLVGRISAPKRVPSFEGTVDLRADDLRSIASLLGIELGTLPADRLRRFALKAKIKADERSVLVPRLDAKLDTSTVTGSVSIANGKAGKSGAKAQVTANLSIDRLVLDAYLARPRARPAPAAADAPPSASSGGRAANAEKDAAKPAGARPAWLDGYDIAGTVHVAKLDYRDLALTEVDINPLWRNGVLTIGELKVADLAGLAIEASGTGRALDGPAPQIEAKVNVNAASLAALGRALGLEPGLRLGSLGRASATATLKGGLDSITIDGSLTSEAGALALVGEIDGLAAGPTVALDLRLENATDETVRALLGARPGAPNEAATPLALEGRLTGDETNLAFAATRLSVGPTEVAGDIAIRLGGPRPYVSAALKSEHFVTPGAALEGGGLATVAPAAGRPDPLEERTVKRVERQAKKQKAPTPTRWSREPFDLSALTDFDGDLTLEAARLSLGDWLAENATVVAALKEGVLDISRFEGRLFDGALAGQARLVATARPVYAIEFTLEDADIDQLLRATGEADAATGRVTLRGQLDAEGTSEHAIVNSLEGPVEVQGRDGSLEGIDLAALRSALDKLDSLNDLTDLAEINLSRGSTPIQTFDGTVQFNRGVARTDNLRAVSESGVCTIVGSANLPRWHLDGTATCDLGVADAAPVGVRLVGPIDKPARQFQIDELLAVAGKRLAAKALTEEGLKLKVRKGAKTDAGELADQVLRNVLGVPDAPEEDQPADEDLPQRRSEPEGPAWDPPFEPELEPEPQPSETPDLTDLLKQVVPDLLSPQ